MTSDNIDSVIQTLKLMRDQHDVSPDGEEDIDICIAHLLNINNELTQLKDLSENHLRIGQDKYDVTLIALSATIMSRLEPIIDVPPNLETKPNGVANE